MKRAEKIAYAALFAIFVGVEALLFVFAMDEAMSSFLMILIGLMNVVGLICLTISFLLASNALKENQSREPKRKPIDITESWKKNHE